MRALIASVLLSIAASLSFAAQPFTVSGSFVQAPGVQLWNADFDLGPMQWFVLDSSTLSNGTVSSWSPTSASVNQSVVATQATSANQPTYSSAALGGIGGVSFSGTQSLALPAITDPWRYHNAFMAVFQANITGAANSSGSFFSISGASTGNGQREPYLGYIKGSPNQIVAQWGTGANACIVQANWPDDTNPHVVESRRSPVTCYLSVDSSTEASSGTASVMMRATGATGLVGDFRSTSINWTLNYLAFEQWQMSADMAQRFAAYEMWRIGKQASIPGGNPWASTPPTSSPYVSPYYQTTVAQFNSTVLPCFDVDTNSCLKGQYPNSFASLIANAPTLIWSQTFTNINMIGSENAPAGGSAVLFGPTVDSGCPSPVICVDPSVNSPAVFSQTGSEIDCTMQKSGATWYACQLTSVNINGQGFTFSAATGPVYVVASVKLNPGNGKSCWAAPLWFEDVGQFFGATNRRIEIDESETYCSEGSGQNNHVTQFVHGPAFPYGSNGFGIGTQAGEDFQLNVPNGWPGAPVSTYDLAFHLYQLYIDTTETCAGLDNNILGCWPTESYALNQLYINVDLYQLPDEASLASGTYVLSLGSIQVYQGTY